MSEYPLLESLLLPSDIQKLSYEELDKLAAETREYIISCVSKNGGHLAPSLGVVELTIAVLRMCDPLHDRVIWDVSHQSYPFKILTDRFSRFHTVRTFGGISGFTKIEESPYDAFGTGHSSTSISAGLGIVSADKILGRERKVFAIIGDGALSGGMAFEGLNSLGISKKRMIVILNDNEMSISPNVGAISNALSRMVTGEVASSLRNDVNKVISAIPLRRLRKLGHKFEESIISFFTTGTLFEEFGLRYIGPVNGHKVKDIEKAIATAYAYDGPVLIHVSTKKGKGYAPAEENPSLFHGVGSFNAETGEIFPSKGISWTQAFGDKLVSMAEKDKRIVAITAAMSDGTGLNKFRDAFPDRFFDTGIAEQHAMTFAAGLAVSGARPYVALYSSFLQRAFDQVIHDVALQKLPVRICIDRGGLVGQDGPTHHGVFDISYLRIIPNLAIMLPRDIKELEDMMELSLDWDGPVAVRYARGSAFSDNNIPRHEIVPGEPEIIYHGKDCAVIFAGHIFDEAYKLWKMLEDSGRSSSLINLRFIKPLNMDSILKELNGKKTVFTFEDNVISGGAGEMLKIAIKDSYPETDVHIMAVPDKFITQGTIKELRLECGLTAENAFKLLKN